MARVVQRRTTPYLLIVFVFLFVFAMLMAMLFYNKYDRSEKQLAEFRQTEQQLISADQSRLPEIKELISGYKKARPGERDAQTVVGQLRAQVTSLARDITGLDNNTFEEAKQRIAQTVQTLSLSNQSDPKLLGLLTDANSQLRAKDAAVDKLKAEAEQMKADLAKAQEQQAAAKKDLEKTIKDNADQIAGLDAKFTALSQQTVANRDDAKKAFDASVEEINKNTAAVVKELEARTRERDVIRRKYEDLLRQMARAPQEFGKGVYRPDGKVVSVAQADGMVYLDIGAKDHVTEGLQFAVYPYTGIPQSGKGKGVVEVVNVSQAVSEARIIQQDKSTPIIAGDQVANVVFDTMRNYNLLVEGTFDLNETGDSTAAGNRAVQELIRRYGGNIVKDLGIETDFVVLGDQPGKPKKPEESAPQEEWDLYGERLKDFNRYQQIKDTATSMKIPVISSRRFLDLIGYVPTKAKAG